LDPDAYLQERIAEKADSIAAVEKALAAIEQQRREIDEWERFHLAHAFVMIFNGIYRAAPVDVEMAMLPPEDRITAVTLPAVFGNCGLAVLREVLRAVQAEPVRPFPHLGPVRLNLEERQS
jgi:hypothetical protein